MKAWSIEDRLEDLAYLAESSEGFVLTATGEVRREIAERYRKLEQENEMLVKHIREHAPGTLPNTHKETP